jgi:hypothetical protein
LPGAAVGEGVVAAAAAAAGSAVEHPPADSPGPGGPQDDPQAAAQWVGADSQAAARA